MKFTKQKKIRECYLKDIRKPVTGKFLWLPLTIDGETRWLERANILYAAEPRTTLFGSRYYTWKAWEFLNK